MSEASVKKALGEVWRSGASHGDGLVLDASVLLRAGTDEESRELLAGAVLTRLLGTFVAERGFVFGLRPSRTEATELTGCIASRDLDGDRVSAPERKVPATALFEAASSGSPVFRALGAGDGDERGTSSMLALPAMADNRCLGVLVLENRFQDLQVTDESVSLAHAYVSHLGRELDRAWLASENACLWRDLNRLRDTIEASSTDVSALKTQGKGREPKRKGLKGNYAMIVGSSPKVVEILQVIDRISTSIAPVLINGESGTGKELIALAVHENSPRRGKPFVSENCAAITETLLESELFGYVKGAFTGANKDHKGLFELANGGTLFLDEVGDMSPSMQKKLLRVLQEGVIRRVGAKDYTPVDVRIISATNKDLLSECKSGGFREDLYYRLNVINLCLPPLRDRREDVPELVRFFLDENERNTGTTTEIEPAALQKLVQYSWPGNVRELQNEVKKLCALSEGHVIRPSDLSDQLVIGETASGGLSEWPFELGQLTLREATEQLEKELIRAALVESGGNKSIVAKMLQIPKTSLYNKINKYKLS